MTCHLILCKSCKISKISLLHGINPTNEGPLTCFLPNIYPIRILALPDLSVNSYICTLQPSIPVTVKIFTKIITIDNFIQHKLFFEVLEIDRNTLSLCFIDLGQLLFDAQI